MQSHGLTQRKLVVVAPSIKSNTRDGVASICQQTLNANKLTIADTAHGESVALAGACRRIGEWIKALAVDGGIVATHVEDGNASEMAVEQRACIVSCVGGFTGIGEWNVCDADGEQVGGAQGGRDGDAAIVRRFGASGSQVCLNWLPGLVLFIVHQPWLILYGADEEL